MIKTLRQFISHLFIAIWAYFPSLIICILMYNIFWSISQSKDLLFAQTFDKNESWLFILAALFLFYTVWHSSEIIGINKVRRNSATRSAEDTLLPPESILKKIYIYPSKQFFGTVSIIIAYIVYSIVISSFFRIEEYSNGQPNNPSFLSYILLFFILQYSFYILLNRINNENVKNHEDNKYIKLLFIIIGIIAVSYYIINMYVLKDPVHFTIPITGVLTVFLVQLIRKTLLIKYDPTKFTRSRLIDKILDAYGIQNKFAVSFLIFNIIGIAVFMIYVVCISDIKAVQTLGPLTFLLIAMGIIIGVINFIIFLSIKAGFNIYVFIFIFALIFGQKENHFVRTTQPEKEVYSKISLSTHIEQFFNQFDQNSSYEIPMYFVLANGGASRAGWWCSGILAHLQETTQFKSEKTFYQHLFAISSASGGSIGSASFLYKHKYNSSDDTLYNSLRDVFQHDLLSPGLSYFLSFDLGRYLLPISFSTIDRNFKLEQAFDQAMDIEDKNIPIQNLFTNEAYQYSPLFAFNVTRMQDGAPGVVTNLIFDKSRFNNRVNVLNILNADTTLTISSAAFLSARFPYISPAGRINANDGSVHYYVDGGYFDNSGAGFIQELLVETQKIINSNPAYEKYKNRISYNIIHVKNSASQDIKLEKTNPFQNDFLSPIITIMGAYNMQTNTNDYRLVNFINDRQFCYDTLTLIDTNQFHYPMNWVLSEFVMKRMDSLIQVQTHVFKEKYKINRY